MRNIDNNTINKFSGKLNEILQLEIKAGNEIVETYEGDWPCKNAIMIFLGKPFKTQIQRNMIGIVFRDINDPHYWKAEYMDKNNNMWLCCGFDGPNFDPLN